MYNFSSLTRDPTCTPFIERWSLSHWTAGRVPALYFFLKGYLKQIILVIVGKSSGEEIKDGTLKRILKKKKIPA